MSPGGHTRAAPMIFLLAFLFAVPSVWAAQSVTGTWEYSGPAESGLWLKTEQTKHTVRFQLEISRGSPSYNSGWIEGEFSLRQNAGDFRKTTDSGVCEISFLFQANRVELTQTGDHAGCGFGHNVFATGVLKRTGRSKPRFCADDPRAVKCGDVSR